MLPDNVVADGATDTHRRWLAERCQQLRPFAQEYQRLREIEQLIALVQQHDATTVGWADLAIGLADDALARA